jgi:peroxiredoxin
MDTKRKSYTSEYKLKVVLESMQRDTCAGYLAHPFLENDKFFERMCQVASTGVAMSRSDNLYELPKNLPIPIDDGACDHLTGLRLPSVPLMSTAGTPVDLAHLSGITVVYCYPRTGRPDQDPPDGWDLIPGARGCTPQSCAFRDHYQQLRQVGVAQVCGLSTQTSSYQREAVERLHLPFALLSDAELAFTRALQLPTFEVAGMTLIKRLTLIITNGKIVKVFYPVFPPDQNAAEVLTWLSEHPQYTKS